MRPLFVRILSSSALAAVFAAAVFAQVPVTQILRGTVVDANGDPVPGAEIVVQRPGSFTVCPAGDDGRFECGIGGSGPLELSVKAAGFGDYTISLTETEAFSGPLTVTLQTAALREQVVVTAEGSESRIGETAASIEVLSSEDILTTAATGIDDALRQTPGFTLFRRSTSRTANPTTQGASLRGINPSGASRSLVLLDDVPLNDPFGGWVPWASVAPIATGSVEVLRGGSSSLYGSDSIGGTIAIRRRTLSRLNTFSAEAFGGSSETASGSFFGGLKRKRFEADLTAAALTTDGYIPVEEAVRGGADEAAGTRDLNLSGRFAPNFGPRLKAFVRGSYFAERRRNGTRLQRNRTNSRRLEAGLDPLIPDLPGTSSTSLSIRAFGIFQVFDQTFSAVSDDRDSESLVRVQRVPSQSLGFSARFATVAGPHAVLAGFDARNTRGASDETGFFAGNATSVTGSGGGETSAGIFLQDRVSISDRVILTGRLRFDSWSNYGGLRTDLRLSDGNMTITKFADRDERALSPGASVLVRITESVSGYFNASRSFRAPTLNELYRGFRVGDIVTLANEDLRAERSLNLEGGASFWKRNFGLRVSVFSASIDDSVSNVTIDASGSPIIRQRRNAAEVLVRGFEAESEVRSGDLSFSAGYLFSDARFEDFPSEPDLEGNLLPQSARHNVTMRFRYADEYGRTFAAQGRASSSQFDDDLNRFRLPAYFQLDLFGGFRLGENVSFFGAVENVFNSRYTVGLTPVRTISAPFTVRAGMRWN
ncbi:MAG: TonB-dependent receptor [Acidobacteriota bacterium]|nr:MAG: TonB-dependent receptor [Acidobacteriota bacterium]